VIAIRNIPSRLGITSVNFKIRFILAIGIEIAYMVFSRYFYSFFRSGVISFAEVESWRTPLRLFTALLLWLLMADLIFSRRPDLQSLRQLGFIRGAALALAASFVLHNYSIPTRDILIVAAASLPVAIHEEFFYRGILQNLFVKYLGTWGGLAAAIVVFSAFHVGVSRPTFGNFFGIALAGLILGIVYLKTGSITAIVLCHTIYDGVASGTTVSSQFLQIFSLVMLVMAAASIVGWSRTPPPYPLVSDGGGSG
jgi:membrane protease YdiL (CAAX protease family)